MKRLCILTLIATFAAAGLLQAQNPLSNDAKNSYTGIKNTITRAAEEMPEADYSFSTVPGKVRTYGEIIGHIADIQLMLCGIAKGESKRGDAGTKKTKAELTAALKASFDYCDGVYNAMTDAEGATMVKMFGRDLTKLGVLNFNTAHDNEMYGTAVAYLRIKGLVPPSSQGRP
ncbi:MAG: DinB family protein [Acidobacteriia bacterium]|nr:DinB family protein [Terriglobia bacterium]